MRDEGRRTMQIVTALFDEWTDGRRISSLGTNAGARPIAFQSWHHFKEAFPPELIRQAVEASPEPPRGIFDPFGGSGTTALASQLLGVASTTVEVNPFLADVIRAKLTRYDTDSLIEAFSRIHRRARRFKRDPREVFEDTPPTFIESRGVERWLFDLGTATQLAQLRSSIEAEEEDDVRRFFRVLLGGILVEVSNVVISGKGRRYRRNWQDREVPENAALSLFSTRCTNAIAEVHRYRRRPRARWTVMNGDSRSVRPRGRHSLAIFSPPYPNSFDYTDVYNVELWMLGYLAGSTDNAELRRTTVSSHVQIYRDFSEPPEGSRKLDRTLRALEKSREALWSRWIPEMVGAYFSDMLRVLKRVQVCTDPGSECWMMVGDSRYAGTPIPSGKIIAELAEGRGWTIQSMSACRSMKGSAQQGRAALAENLLVMTVPG